MYMIYIIIFVTRRLRIALAVGGVPLNCESKPLF